MKCQLVGFSHGEYTNKETGVVTRNCTLYFVRKPNLSETVEGNVCSKCVVYDDNIAKLPELVVNQNYDCDINSYKGKDYLREIAKI